MGSGYAMAWMEARQLDFVLRRGEWLVGFGENAGDGHCEKEAPPGSRSGLSMPRWALGVLVRGAVLTRSGRRGRATYLWTLECGPLWVVVMVAGDTLVASISVQRHRLPEPVLPTTEALTSHHTQQEQALSIKHQRWRATDTAANDVPGDTHLITHAKPGSMSTARAALGPPCRLQ